MMGILLSGWVRCWTVEDIEDGECRDDGGVVASVGIFVVRTEILCVGCEDIEDGDVCEDGDIVVRRGDIM